VLFIYICAKAKVCASNPRTDAKPRNVTTNAKKDRQHRKTMNENRHDIQTKLTKRTDFQADRVLLLGQVTEKKEKAHPSHFLKFLFASRTNGTFGFALHTNHCFAKPKEPFFINA
jgi:hypothetical protein